MHNCCDTKIACNKIACKLLHLDWIYQSHCLCTTLKVQKRCLCITLKVQKHKNNRRTLLLPRVLSCVSTSRFSRAQLAFPSNCYVTAAGLRFHLKILHVHAWKLTIKCLLAARKLRNPASYSHKFIIAQVQIVQKSLTIKTTNKRTNQVKTDTRARWWSYEMQMRPSHYYVNLFSFFFCALFNNSIWRETEFGTVWRNCTKTCLLIRFKTKPKSWIYNRRRLVLVLLELLLCKFENVRATRWGQYVISAPVTLNYNWIDSSMPSFGLARAFSLQIQRRCCTSNLNVISSPASPNSNQIDWDYQRENPVLDLDQFSCSTKPKTWIYNRRRLVLVLLELLLLCKFDNVLATRWRQYVISSNVTLNYNRNNSSTPSFGLALSFSLQIQRRCCTSNLHVISSPASPNSNQIDWGYERENPVLDLDQCSRNTNFLTIDFPYP